MPKFSALYYPTWNPPVEFIRATLLFFDCIEVIIPTDVEADYDDKNKEVFDLVPDSLGERREQQYELDISGSDWKRIANALDLLVEEKPPKDEIVLEFPDSGGFQIENHVFTHDAKMTPRFYNLLRDRNLLREDAVEYTKALSNREGFHVVDERASCLLLSLLADTQARKYGLRTLTDEPISYSVNFLNANSPGHANAVNAALASTIIETQIPKTISALKPDQYVELRKSFEDVRMPFQRAMRSLSEDYNLQAIGDKKTFEEAILELTQDFQKSVEKFRTTSKWEDKDWTNFGVAALTALPGLYSTVISEGPAWLSGALLGAAGLQLSYTCYQTITTKQEEDDVQKSQRLIGGLKDELVAPKLIDRIIGQRK